LFKAPGETIAVPAKRGKDYPASWQKGRGRRSALVAGMQNLSEEAGINSTGKGKKEGAESHKKAQDQGGVQLQKTWRPLVLLLRGRGTKVAAF